VIELHDSRGDPSGTGSAGTGYVFKDEFTDLKFDKEVFFSYGQLWSTNSSQFLTHKDTPWLNGNILGM
jgi:cyclophilin family peptidyl-prolyl cis-trans isomerase